MHESGIDGAKCCRKVASERTVAGVIKSLANAKSLRLPFALALYEGLHIYVITNGSVTIWTM